MLSSEQMNEGGDTEILPLGEEIPAPSDTDISKAKLGTSMGPPEARAEEVEILQEINAAAEAEAHSSLPAAHNELPAEVTALLNDPEITGTGDGRRGVVATDMLEGEIVLDDRTLVDTHRAGDSPEAIASFVGTEMESSEESMSEEESSSQDSEEIGAEHDDEADELLDHASPALQELSEPANAEPELSTGNAAAAVGETNALKSQLAKAKRHAKLYYTKVKKKAYPFMMRNAALLLLL